MTRTIDLLEDVLNTEYAEPEAADVMARLPVLIRRRHRRRQTIAAVVGAAAVLTGSLVALQNPPPSNDAATGVLGAPMLIEVFLPDAAVSVVSIRPGQVQASVLVANRSLTLEAYAAGAIPAGLIEQWRASGQETTVSGHPGFYVTGEVPSSLVSHPGMPPPPMLPLPGLAWEYAPGAWAFLSGRCDGCADERAALQEAAGLVHFGPKALFRVPLRFGYGPPGLPLYELMRTGVGGNGPHFSRGDQPFVSGAWFTDGRSMFGVSAAPANGTAWHPTWPTRPADEFINGHKVWWDEPLRASAFAEFGTCHVHVDMRTHDETVRVVEGLTTADCLDPATWFDARDIGVPPATDPPRPPYWLPS